MKLTTHILDLATSRPAQGIEVTLVRIDGDTATKIGSGVTDNVGRTDSLTSATPAAGTYELRFAVGAYFERNGVAAFFTTIPVRFEISEVDRNYHIPLLLSPFGYTTYLGS